MNLSCEVSLDDYSDTIAAGVSSRSGTHSGLCMKLWVISLVWIDLFVITMPNISIKQPQNISKNSGGFAPGPPCLHFLLTTINKFDPDFRSGGLTHVTPNTESVSAGLKPTKRSRSLQALHSKSGSRWSRGQAPPNLLSPRAAILSGY